MAYPKDASFSKLYEVGDAKSYNYIELKKNCPHRILHIARRLIKRHSHSYTTIKYQLFRNFLKSHNYRYQLTKVYSQTGKLLFNRNRAISTDYIRAGPNEKCIPYQLKNDMLAAR